MGQAAVQPGAPEALVPSAHSAHLGGVEAALMGARPVLAGVVASALSDVKQRRQAALATL